MSDVGAVAWGPPRTSAWVPGAAGAAGRMFRVGLAVVLAGSGLAAVSQVPWASPQTTSEGSTAVMETGWWESVPKVNATAGLSGLLSLPTVAQVAVNRDLGADNPPYDITATAAGWTAHNPIYGFDAVFTPEGVRFETAGVGVSLALAGVGRGNAVTAPGTAAPVAVASNTVAYDYPGVRETWRHGPLGMAQDFTILQRPAGSGVVSVALSTGEAAVSVAESGTQAVLTSPDGAVFRYRSLVALDADGKRLPAVMTATEGHLVLRVDDTHATYPITIDPFVHTNTIAGLTERFGFAVAAARGQEATYFVVGDPYHQAHKGRTSVYRYRDSKLMADLLSREDGTSAGDLYGFSVDILLEQQSDPQNPNGYYLLAGAPGFENGKGIAYVYSSVTGLAHCNQSNGTWVKLSSTKRVGGGLTATQLGYSVALARNNHINGMTAFVGMPYYDHGTVPDAGAVMVYDSNCWVYDGWYQNEDVMLRSNNPGSGDLLGFSLAADSKSLYLAAGAIGDEGHGTVHMFQRPVINHPLDEGQQLHFQTRWKNHAGLTEHILLPRVQNDVTPAAGDKFGFSVDVSENGEGLVVGAPNAWNNRGVAYVFEPLEYRPLYGEMVPVWNVSYTHTATALLRELQARADTWDRTGSAVAITGTGHRIAVGAPGAEDSAGMGNFTDEGMVLVFHRKSTGGWANDDDSTAGLANHYPDQRLSADTEKQFANFGFSVSLAHREGEGELHIGKPGYGDPGSTTPLSSVERWQFQ